MLHILDQVTQYFWVLKNLMRVVDNKPDDVKLSWEVFNIILDWCILKTFSQKDKAVSKTELSL